MSGFFSGNDGNFDRVFMTTTDLIDQFVGESLFSCGYNTSGQLGDNTSVSKSSLVQVVGSAVNWKQVAVGISHTAAVKTDGTLWTWGYNFQGQLGDNTSSTASKSSPVSTVGGQGSWRRVACGGNFTAAIKTDGTLWLWGVGTRGQLGDNTLSGKSSPVTTVAGGTNWKQVSCGYLHTAAVKTDGTLWTWGDNTRGQLGDNTISTASKSSPVTTAGGGTNWKQVACGNEHTAAVKTDGTLWTWGRDSYGQLGDNSTTNRSSPVTTVAGGTNWKQVGMGCRSLDTAAIKTDGTLWLWGRNSSGQLGDNTSVDKSSPVTTVAGGTNWKQVAGGISHTAAIKTDGTLWTWGLNTAGRLGDNTTTTRSSPVRPVGSFNNFLQVECSTHTACRVQKV